MLETTQFPKESQKEAIFFKKIKIKDHTVFR